MAALSRVMRVGGWCRAQAQYERMSEEHGALLENLEASEAARADLEQSISSMKVQGARDKRERMWVAPSFAQSTCVLLLCWPRLFCTATP